jgi:hypothetical protein
MVGMASSLLLQYRLAWKKPVTAERRTRAIPFCAAALSMTRGRDVSLAPGVNLASPDVLRFARRASYTCDRTTGVPVYGSTRRAPCIAVMANCRASRQPWQGHWNRPAASSPPCFATFNWRCDRSAVGVAGMSVAA